METGRHNWILRCIAVCLALMCWNGTDSSAHDGSGEDGSAWGIVGWSSSLVVAEAEEDAFLSCETATASLYNPCFTAPSRTPAKLGRQHTAKQSRHGGSPIKAGRAVSEYVISLYLKSIVNFPPGTDDSKPLFICLRKLLL